VRVLCTVDANNAGSGELSIVVNNGDVPSSARLIAQNIYAVSFMPCEPGVYSVELFFNCEPLKGLMSFISLAPSPNFSISGLLYRQLHRIALGVFIGHIGHKSTV